MDPSLASPLTELTLRTSSLAPDAEAGPPYAKGESGYGRGQVSRLWHPVLALPKRALSGPRTVVQARDREGPEEPEHLGLCGRGVLLVG